MCVLCVCVCVCVWCVCVVCTVYNGAFLCTRGGCEVPRPSLVCHPLYSALPSLCAGEVIFSYLEPTLPPDLVFAKSDFNPDIERLTVSRGRGSGREATLFVVLGCMWCATADVQASSLLYLQVLSEWSPEDPSMLALLLQQVLEQFAVHSSGLLSQHQRLQFELHTLEESEQYSKVEVLCHQSEEVSLMGWYSSSCEVGCGEVMGG